MAHIKKKIFRGKKRQQKIWQRLEKKPKTPIIREAHLLLVIRKMKINTRKYHVMHNRLSPKIFLMNSFIIPCTRTSIDC